MSTIIPYRLLHLLPCGYRLIIRVDRRFLRRLVVDVSYSFYQHLSEIQCAVQNTYNEYGLWTADTWAMSADAQLCHSGQWTPTDQRWQFGDASLKSRLLMARIGLAIMRRTLPTYDPAP